MCAAKYIELLLAVIPLLAASASGTSFPAPVVAEPRAAALTKAALAGTIYGADATWSHDSLPLGKTRLLMRIQSGAFCGDVGYPTTVRLNALSGRTAAWTGMSTGKGTVLASMHHGLCDIAFNVRNGKYALGKLL